MNIPSLFFKQFRMLEQLQNMIALAEVSPPTRKAAFKTIEILNSGHPANIRWIPLKVEEELLSLGFEVRRLGPPNNHKNTLCEISFGDETPDEEMPTVRIEVEGGVAEAVSVPEGIKVVIYDHDNKEATPDDEVYEPDVTIGPSP